MNAFRKARKEAGLDELQEAAEEAAEKAVSVGESTSVIRVIGGAATEIHGKLAQEMKRPRHRGPTR
jgi:hypothetical protein